MIAQAIGYSAAGIALLCLVGLFAIRVLWPKAGGKHAPGGRHREQPHDGAGSPGHTDELATLRLVVDRARRRRDETGEMADLFDTDDGPDKDGAA